LARELRELQLPFAAPESMTLMDSTEVQDLVALLDVLASPQHHLSLARALKSPIFGASDEDLILLADRVKVLRAEGAGAPRADHETSWWAALMNPSAQGLSPALRRARTLLKSWQRMVCQVSPHDLLDHIVHKGEVF
jgi:ATP-dependent helicase/nuclease subunit A